jgi:hypothetical protein
MMPRPLPYNTNRWRADAADWTYWNTVLPEGDLGEETDSGLTKTGIRDVHWNDLAYNTPGPQGCAGRSGIAGRTGHPRHSGGSRSPRRSRGPRVAGNPRHSGHAGQPRRCRCSRNAGHPRHTGGCRQRWGRWLSGRRRGELHVVGGLDHRRHHRCADHPFRRLFDL